MTRSLPDVNVLLALLWPRHNGHRAAQEWFAASGYRAWATNPLTQLGAVRLLTNPAVTLGVVDARSAIGILREATTHAGHEFWPMDCDIPTALEETIPAIGGHKQWTDAALLWQASVRGGTLVTFDSGVRELAGKKWSRHALILKYQA